jgi:hypothetical protein
MHRAPIKLWELRKGQQFERLLHWPLVLFPYVALSVSATAWFADINRQKVSKLMGEHTLDWSVRVVFATNIREGRQILGI